MNNFEQSLSPEEKKAISTGGEQGRNPETESTPRYEILFDDRGRPIKLFVNGKEVPFANVPWDDKRGTELLGDPQSFGNPSWEEIDNA